jgi:hypothetical protein
MEAYLDAFAKVLTNLDAVLDGPFEPLLFD